MKQPFKISLKPKEMINGVFHTSLMKKNKLYSYEISLSIHAPLCSPLGSKGFTSSILV